MSPSITLDPGIPTMAAASLAHGWLAAAAAGTVSKWDNRFDRVVLLERGRHGWSIIGVSTDLVVVSHVPFEGHRAAHVEEDTLENSDPDRLRYIADDTARGAMGAKTLRGALSRAKLENDRGSLLLATLHPAEYIPEGGMVGHRTLQLDVDRFARAYIDQGTWSTAPWREALPSPESTPHVPTSALHREVPSASARIVRLLSHLADEGVDVIDWQLHELPAGSAVTAGTLVKYTRVEAHGCVFEVAAACATSGEPGAPAPTIFRAEHKPDPATEATRYEHVGSSAIGGVDDPDDDEDGDGEFVIDQPTDRHLAAVPNPFPEA